MSSPESNPDKRPLPDGWITEHSPQWNAWFYVDTKAQNPQAIWTHPLDNKATPSSPSPAYTAESSAGHAASPPPAATPGQPTNPDTRPLPPGYVSQYSAEHKTFFYVNESAPDPGSTVTWTHPADTQIPPTNISSPATASTQASHANPAASTGAAAAPGGHQNPDKRELPPGWKTDYDTNYKAWYYINTNDPAGGASWTHPAETHGPAAATPATTGGSAHPVASPGPGGPETENPDKRPLPPGWITKFDDNYKVWYYVDTTKPGSGASWEHPAGAASTPGPATPAAPGPHSAGTPGPASPYGAPANQAYGAPGNQGYGGQPDQGHGGGGKGIEGLLGGSAGKMVGGLFGAKGRAQMDSFANKLGPGVSKLTGKYGGGGGGGGHGQPGGYPPAGQVPPGQGYGHGPGPGQGGGYPGQAPGQQGHGQGGGYPGAAGGQYGPPGGQQQQHHGGGGGQFNVSGLTGKLGGFLKK